MTRITIDPSLTRKLGNLKQPLELCDEGGNVLARVVPVLDANEHVLEPQVSEEELDRRQHSLEKAFTTAEVLAHLEKV